MVLDSIDPAQLAPKDAARPVWIPVARAAGLLWAENPKLHDLDQIIASIARHGFQELPVFDRHLPNVLGGAGAIKAGNGRIEALARMEASGEHDLPRGLAAHKATGQWCLQVLVGTDAPSLALARAYAIDSNNLVLGAGDFEPGAAARMWDEGGYADVLRLASDAGALPVSVAPNDAAALWLGDDVPQRPDHAGLVERFAEQRGQTGKDEQWFYVEFYGDDRFAALQARLKSHLVEGTAHQLQPDFVYALVMAHVEPHDDPT